MPILVIEKGKDKGKKLTLEKDKPLEAGRGQNVGLRLRDSMTSRTHFKIFFAKNDWYVNDLKSSNGTFLNGKKITLLFATQIAENLKVFGIIIIAKEAHPSWIGRYHGMTQQ